MIDFNILCQDYLKKFPEIKEESFPSMVLDYFSLFPFIFTNNPNY